MAAEPTSRALGGSVVAAGAVLDAVSSIGLNWSARRVGLISDSLVQRLASCTDSGFLSRRVTARVLATFTDVCSFDIGVTVLSVAWDVSGACTISDTETFAS